MSKNPSAAPLPQPGAWVARIGEDDNSLRPSIARVKDAYRDPLPGGTTGLLDLIFYGHDGVRLGRVSPHMGGPRGFEPACSAELWVEIHKPDFEALTKTAWRGYRDLLVPVSAHACPATDQAS